MHYIVCARLIESSAAEFHRKLTDGTVAAQNPDGKEIVDSMRRARIGEDGLVRWSEVCYCEPPLDHERGTVLDRHFEAIETEEAEGYVEFAGAPLMEHLARAASVKES